MSSDNSNAVTGDTPAGNFQAFYSEITASVTHELNNVLGTIEQVAGLLEDLAMMPAGSESPSVERLGSLSEKIVRQTDRGMELVKRLNKFAHLGDEVISECDIGGLVETMVALAQRFARLRGVTLAAELPDQPVTLVTNPILISELLFRCIKRTLDLAAADAELVVSLSTSDNSAAIRIAARCKEDASDSPRLPASLEKPPVKVVETIRDNHICIEVVVAEGAGR